MKSKIVISLIVGFAFLFVASMTGASEEEKPAAPDATPNRLTTPQMMAGWRLLFDGQTTTGWRGYKSDKMPGKGWIVEDGCLRVQAGGGGGDIITAKQYGDFDLRLEYKVSEKANSGIMYLVTEDEKSTWHTGPEYQIFDDAGFGLDPAAGHAAGALYAIYNPPKDKVANPAGEWNSVRIVKRGQRIEHWLNGIQLLEGVIGSDDWNERVGKSKFSKFHKFGTNPRGHIALQDHGNDVWFRNMRIRDLTPLPGMKAISLFNGKDMTGWTYYLADDTKMEDVWRVEDGNIICAGKPAGYIKTEKDFTSFILKLQWRFNPVTKKAGNSGVLMRMTGEDKIWPRSLEAQLMSGYAGDFWVIEGFPVKTDPERTKGRNCRRTHPNEHAVGQWNDYEIIVNGPNVVLIVNGEVLNAAAEAEVIPGRICLQSEGVEIQFRDIMLFPIEK